MRARILPLQIVAPIAVALGICVLAPLAAAQGGYIRERRELPDDPLAGLGDTAPSTRPNQGKVKASTAPRCQVVPRAKDANAIGDLRALLLATRPVPDYILCPKTPPRGEIRLRLAISGAGKIERIEPVEGDPSIARQISALLQQRTCPARIQGGTVGELIYAVKAAKPAS